MMNDHRFKKPKKNKLRIGDTVLIKRSQVEWYSENLTWLYGVDKEDGTKEITANDMPEVLFWVLSREMNIRPKGKVIRYGSDDDIKPGRRNVRVDLTLPKKIDKFLGKKLTYSYFFCEDDLEKK